MTCRICGEKATVYQTLKENDHVVRYRRCSKCNHQFITLEMDDDMWRAISDMKKTEDITRTIGKAIREHLTISQNINIKKMAEFITHRLFAEVKHEV